MSAPASIEVWRAALTPYVSPMRDLMRSIAQARILGGAYELVDGEHQQFIPTESIVEYSYRWAALSRYRYRFWVYGDKYEARQQELYSIHLRYVPERTWGLGGFQLPTSIFVPVTGDVAQDIQACHQAFNDAFSTGVLGVVYRRSNGESQKWWERAIRRAPPSDWYMKLPRGDRWLGNKKPRAGGFA